MKQLTFQDILDMGPCEKHHPSKYIPKTWAGTVLDILHLPNVMPTEKLWVVYRALDDKVLRLFAVACARRTLGRVIKPDPRSIRAVDMAEAYAHGRAAAKELQLAYRVAADAVAYVADAADATAADATAADVAAYVAAVAYVADDADAAVAADAVAYVAVTAADVAAAVAVTAYAADDADAAVAAAVAAREKERAQQIEDLIKLVKEEV